MVTIEVQNFQSIEHVTFKVDGFTALVGRSNIGKSALIRAVKAALTGAPVSAFVRHQKACLRKTKGAKTCKCFVSVRIQATDYDLLWEKGDAVNRYTFNGQVYDKAEKGTPDFLAPAFSPVKVGDQPMLLQVADQFSSIFLLDQTGGTVADVLSDVARLDRINTATRFCERDRKEASATRKVREKDVVDLETKLAGFAGLDAAVGQARATERMLAEIERKDAEVTKICQFITTGTALAQRVRVLEAGVATPVPDATALRAQDERARKLAVWCGGYEAATEAVERLTPVNAVITPAGEPLVAKLAELERLSGWHRRLVGFRDYFNATKPVQALPPLEPPAFKEKLAELERVAGWVRRLAALEATVEDLQRKYDEATTEAEKAHAEVEGLGVCPTCIRPWEVA